MRVNSKNWTITSGVKTGHYHLYKGANCQDAAAIIAGPDMVVGVGCDGCGEGNHSELGAIATANFALREILRLRASGYQLHAIIEQLFPAIVRFIDMNVFLTCPVETPSEVADFIKHHWLCTIVGFILLDEAEHDDNGMFFWCGDGVLFAQANGLDCPEILDQDNTPTYIAYNCVRSPAEVGVMSRHIPKRFSRAPILKAITEVGVASDGFIHHSPDKLQLAKETEPELRDELHGQQWGKKGNVGLKKWMNSRSARGYFEDDCFIITAEAICKP